MMEYQTEKAYVRFAVTEVLEQEVFAAELNEIAKDQLKEYAKYHNMVLVNRPALFREEQSELDKQDGLVFYRAIGRLGVDRRRGDRRTDR